MGLYRLDGERWLHEKLAEPNIRSLVGILEEDDGTVWLADEFGRVLRIAADGTSRFGPRDGLPVSAGSALLAETALDTAEHRP